MVGVAGASMVWARSVFGLRTSHAAAATKGELVRDPICAAILLFFVGALVAHPDALHVGALAVAIFGALMPISAEETERQAACGAEYDAIRARAKRLVPFVV